jgi:broad specificity phosphatase PhoE
MGDMACVTFTVQGKMMTQALPEVYVARHGETVWSLTGQHTGRTDIPLTVRGERHAFGLRQRLVDVVFGKVLVSPRARARRTAELAGFGVQAEIDPDLQEWDYGQYEGRRTADIHKERPAWSLFRDGCPGGESVEAIGDRADRVIGHLRTLESNVLVFSHGHILRVLAARWLGLPAGAGRLFVLSTAALSILGYEHTLEEPAIRLWNDDRHVGEKFRDPAAERAHP